MKVVETNITPRPLEFACAGDRGATSAGFPVNWKVSDLKVPPSGGRTWKLYLDVVATREGNVLHDNKTYKLFVKSKNNQSAQ